MSKEMNDFLNIYGETPSFILPFLESENMKRLDDVGMHCGMEYTSFPFYCDLKKYSRLSHSIGVSIILSHFTDDKKIILSGLFHDISTPCFAHVIDFLYDDYEKQEYTEKATSSFLIEDSIIQSNLKKLNLQTSDVDDYHLYPLADNDSPKLSSDRLEYTLHNLYNYSFASKDEIKNIYNNIIVSTNEFGEIEMLFLDERIAEKFSLLTLKNSIIYTKDEDRYGMQYLSFVIKRAIERGVININDLYLTERELIEKLKSDETTLIEFNSFQRLKKVKKEVNPSSPISFLIKSKKRYIDPYVYNKGRLSKINSKVKTEIQKFLNLSFDYYLIKD